MLRFTPGRKVWSFFGWTPALRRVVSGRLLACECLVGVYETNSGEFLTIVDNVGKSCRETGHTVDRVLAAVAHESGQQPFASMPCGRAQQFWMKSQPLLDDQSTKTER